MQSIDVYFRSKLWNGRWLEKFLRSQIVFLVLIKNQEREENCEVVIKRESLARE